MGSPRLTLQPFATFDVGARAAVEFLQSQLGMGLWMVTRTVDDDWIMLATANREPRYRVAAGDVFRWSDSFCARMVQGQGPHVAADANQIPVYRQAPLATQLPIGAYVGVPLQTADGALFGTLCAIDPGAQPTLSDAALPLVEMVGRLLATVLDRDLKLVAEARRTEIAEANALLDALTGLWNRRAWDKFKASEEARCRRYGHSACVLSIDLDGLKAANDTQGHAAGDALIRRAGHALREAVRAQDAVARTGGDEFVVLLVECSEAQGRQAEQRIRAELAAAGVDASMGFARRGPESTIDAALSAADERMYEEKRARKRT